MVDDGPQEAFAIAREATSHVVAALKADMRDTLNGEERSMLSHVLEGMRGTMDVDSLVYQLEWTAGAFGNAADMAAGNASTRIASSAVAEFVRGFTRH